MDIKFIVVCFIPLFFTTCCVHVVDANSCDSAEWSVFENTCFLVNTQTGLNQSNAELYCKQRNSTLVKLSASDYEGGKYEYLQSIAQKVVYIWIDGKKVLNEMKYLYADGTQVPLNATWWCKNANLTEPGMNCLEYSSDRKCVHNYYCDVDNVYAICEKKVANTGIHVTNSISLFLLFTSYFFLIVQ